MSSSKPYDSEALSAVPQRLARFKYSIYQIRFTKKSETRLEKMPIRASLYPGRSASHFVTGKTLSRLTKIKASFEIVREFCANDHDISIQYSDSSLLHDSPSKHAIAEITAFAFSRRSQGLPYFPLYMGNTRRDLPESFVFDGNLGVHQYRWKWIRKIREADGSNMECRFPKLMRMAKDPNTRFVLSLSGGGLHMFAHAPALKIVELMGLRKHVDEIWGTSAGAIMGMAWSLGADAASLERIGYDFYMDRSGFKVNPGFIDLLKIAVKRLFSSQQELDFGGMINVRELIKWFFSRTAKLKSPTIPVYALTWNMRTKRLEALTPVRKTHSVNKKFIKYSSPLDAVLASTAIPIVFRPHSIKRGLAGVTYIDASMFEELPLTSVLCKWRREKERGLTKQKRLFILGVNLFPRILGIRMPFLNFLKRIPLANLWFIWSRLTDRARRMHIFNQIRTATNFSDVKVATLTVGSHFKHFILNPDIIPSVIENARESFLQQLENIERDL